MTMRKIAAIDEKSATVSLPVALFTVIPIRYEYSDRFLFKIYITGDVHGPGNEKISLLSIFYGL